MNTIMRFMLMHIFVIGLIAKGGYASKFIENKMNRRKREFEYTGAYLL